LETSPEKRMIIFDLACNNGHHFEGWFQSADAFDAQRAGGLVSCPGCGSTEIRRVPSAIHLSGTPEAAPPLAAAARVDPRGEWLNAYRRLVAAIMTQSEDVGTEFAGEVRKIHYFEAPARSIRGQASEKEFESLCEEGIEVFRLPVIKNEDLN
jgi:hypothetical protein